MKTLLILLCSSLVHCSAAPATVSAPPLPVPVPQEAAADEPSRADPAEGAPAGGDAAQEEARALLEKALRFQRGEQPLPAPRALHANFHVTANDPERGGRVTVKVERWYARDPERMLTHRVDDVVDSDSTVGFNDGVAWFVDRRTGDVVRYSDDPETFAVDLEQLDEQLRLMPVLLEVAVLDALVPRLREPRVVGRTQVRDIDRRRVHEVVLVEATVEDELLGPDPDRPPTDGEEPRHLRVRLGIEPDTGAVWTFAVETLDRTRSIAFVIGLHRPTAQGLRLPANITVYEDGRSGEDDYSVKLGVRAIDRGDEEDWIDFEIDPELPPGLFTPPAARRR